MGETNAVGLFRRCSGVLARARLQAGEELVASGWRLGHSVEFSVDSAMTSLQRDRWEPYWLFLRLRYDGGLDDDLPISTTSTGGLSA